MWAKILASVLVILFLFAFAGNAEEQNLFAEDIGTKKPGNLKLEHVLDEMAVNTARAEFLAKEYDINFKDSSVQVIIDIKQFDPQYLETLGKTGAIIEVYDKNLVQAQVPVSMLNVIADFPFVNYIRKPEKYSSFVTSEGVAAINATVLHNLGYNGSGVKIAVLDLGFEGYQSRLGTELPSSAVVRSFRADGDITGGGEVHGTAVAEIVHDVAPGAQIYLVNFATDLEMNSAVNWLISQNVDIISASFGKLTGPKDGTDYADGIVNNAVAAGILWVNAAGNFAEEHWMGSFSDPDNDNFHNFTSNDEGQDIYATAGSRIEVLLDWDDWPYSNQDYDLYLYDSSLGIVASSRNFQTGTQAPFESILYTATYTGYYNIVIKKYSATRNVKFHLYSPGNPNIQYIVPSGSLLIPGTSTGSLTAGAVHWSNDALEPYSSQGPTDDGRVKPDVAAPAGTANSVYGTFSGTSASTPHVSGAAALLLQMDPGVSVNQLKQVLESGAKDLGAPGRDNQYGAGRIDVYSSAQLIQQPDGIVVSVDGTQHLQLDQPFKIADGLSTWTVTAQLRRAGVDMSVPAQAVTFVVNNTNVATFNGNSITTAVTDGTGKATVTLRSTTIPGDVMITGSFLTNNNVLLTDFDLARSAEVTTGTITGIVTDASSGLPIVGASIFMDAETTARTTTGAGGSFTVTSVAAGIHTVRAVAGGFIATAVSVTVQAGLTATVNIGLTPAGPNANGTVTRSFSAPDVLPGGTLTVTMTPGTDAAGRTVGSFYQVTETLPAGVTVVSSTAGNFAPPATFTMPGAGAFTYTIQVAATVSNGTILTFSGTFLDDIRTPGAVTGQNIVRVGSGPAAFDTNGNHLIDRPEAVTAVVQFFGGSIPRATAVQVVVAFFSQTTV